MNFNQFLRNWCLKPFQMILSAFLNLLILNQWAFAVVGGQELSPLDAKNFSAFVSIGEERNVSGGVHIGDGIILTAEHVVQSISQKATIRDINGHEIAEFSLKQTGVVFKPKALRTISANLIVQVPDLAILVPPEEIRKQLRKLPAARMGSFSNLFQVGELQLAGVGRTDFESYPSPSLNSVRVGKFLYSSKSRKNTLETIATVYDGKHGFASGATGDSGSPLWMRDHRGALVVVGIASLISVSASKGRDANPKAESVFTRLDSPVVKRWFLELATKNISEIFSKLCESPLK
jgi:hypothetical protein